MPPFASRAASSDPSGSLGLRDNGAGLIAVVAKCSKDSPGVECEPREEYPHLLRGKLHTWEFQCHGMKRDKT